MRFDARYLSERYDQASECPARRASTHRSARLRYAFVGDRGGKFDHHRSSVELVSSQFTIDRRPNRRHRALDH